MEKNPLADALDRVRLLATAGRFTDLSDGALLDRCVTERDEVAFSVLVDRHGAMVYGACYRILRHPHDTEDACQATFLVLAHKASGIRAAPSVASWLHGVARRVSLTLLRERAERQRRELSATLPEPASAEPPDMTWSEAQALLDEELERLPEQLRAPLVLCYLEGKTRDEAASALRLTAGRLHGLLQRGRTLLRDRLVRRGVTLGAGLLGAEQSVGAGQALSPTLTLRVVNGAVAALRGQELGPALASSQATTLTNEVLRAMFSTKLKSAAVWAAGVGVTLLLVGGGLFAAGFARPAGDADPGADERKTDPTPVPQKPPAEPKPEGQESPKPKMLELRDLKDGDYTIRVTHKAKEPEGKVLDEPIRDALYQLAKDEDLKEDLKGHRELRVRFSEKGKKVTISIGSRGEKVVTGELGKETGDKRVYELKLFAGGSMTLTQTKDGVTATYTVYGSGFPVLGSYRGQLTVAAPKPEPPALRDLKDADYTFRITRAAMAPKGKLLDEPIPDGAYVPVKDEDVKEHQGLRVRFSEKGKRVVILGEGEIANRYNQTGTLERDEDGLRTYDLDGRGGHGRLTLTQTKDGLVATLTYYGSGFPVLGSYRGQLAVSSEGPKVRDVLIVEEPRYNEKGIGKSPALSVTNKDRIARLMAMFPNAHVRQGGDAPTGWKVEYRVHMFYQDGTIVTLTVGTKGRVWTTPANGGDQKTNGDFLKLVKELGE